MSPDDDPILKAVTILPSIVPDDDWQSRVRHRCHSAISRRAAWQGRPRKARPAVVLTSICSSVVLLGYLAVTLAEAVRLLAHP